MTTEFIYTVHFVDRYKEDKFMVITTMVRPDGTLGGRMERSLLSTNFCENNDIDQYNRMIDVLESMVLTHVCQGINIEDEKYAEGVRVAYESIYNHCFHR